MARGPVVFVLVSGVALAAVAFVMLRPQSFVGILPSALVEGLAGLRTAMDPGPADAQTGDAPSDFLVDAPEGLRAEGPIAAVSGNRPVFIADVISGHSTGVSDDVPAEITTIRPIMGCLITPPLPGTVVGNVVAGQSALSLGFLTYNDADLAASVQAFVDGYRQTGSTQIDVPQHLAYQSYDVVVTMTAAPVYLVLQSGDGARIWNIHTAPGVQIERVILLGGNQSGVANLDPVVPVEVVLQEGLAACGIRPAYSLNAGHALVMAAKAGGSEAMSDLAELSAAVDAYDQWFRDSFGIPAASTRTGFDRGAVSVVGPVPDPESPKPAFAAVAGAKIRTTQDDFFEILGQVPEGEDFASRVQAIATTFAFGDLAYLRQGVDF